jgi:5'-methylthioadenosine phosphorylase
MRQRHLRAAMPHPVVGLIGGSGLRDSTLVESAEPRPLDTPYGKTSDPPVVGHHGDTRVVFVLRHGADHRIPPHRVNHRANLWALKELGASAVLATASTGSLKKSIRPGSFLVPDDYVAFWSIPTFHDEQVVHATPGLDRRLRDQLVTAGKAAGASIRSHGGDVVGMTMASEATLASEIGLPYAAVCSVDNYCNGIVERPLTFDQIRETQKRNVDALRRILEMALEGMF